LTLKPLINIENHMPEDISHRLVIAISSRALFDLSESNRIFEEQGLEDYTQYQIERENDVLQPGVAFNMVQKLLNINQYGELVEVILLSRNNADSGLRIFNSIEHYGLDITRAAFTNGGDRYKYIQAFGAQLFLSANPHDVKSALQAGCAAATILPTSQSQSRDDKLRIAFDGDAVIFSDEAEQVFQKEGIEAFHKSESEKAKTPLNVGPFQSFLQSLHQLQKKFSATECPIKTALITAREAPAHERVIRTLREWDVRVDEAVFLGGLDKTAFLDAFGADLFFDDQPHHCESASALVAAAHVPTGIINIASE
jgi:5'-nucleotidase